MKKIILLINSIILTLNIFAQISVVNFNVLPTNNTIPGTTFFGINAGLSSSNSNNSVFVGLQSGQNSNASSGLGFNTYVGQLTGAQNVIGPIDGGYNSYFGNKAGWNATGTSQAANCYFGRQTGQFVNGISNCFIGSWNSPPTTIRNSSRNCFFGYDCGINTNGTTPTEGTNNCFMGYTAGQSNTTGQKNVFVGSQAGLRNTTGINNVFVGADILTTSPAPTNTNNTFIGFNTGTGTQTTGTNTNNICLGSNSQIGNNNTNTIAIGANAQITQNNSMLLGAVRADATYMRVGINTAAPGAQLHVLNSTDVADVNITADGFATQTAHARVNIQSLGQNITSNWFVTTDPATGKLYRRQIPINSGCGVGNFIPKQDPANPTQQTCSQIYDNGTSVGIGYTTTPAAGFANYIGYNTYNAGVYTPFVTPPVTGSARLVVNGVIMAHGLSYTSDKRFKKDIKPITSALDKIKQLNGVTYNWRKEEFKDKNFDNSSQIGFIAQEVEKIVPQAVIKDGEGYYAMNYTMLIPVLTEAMKEQQKMIEAQQKEIDELKAIVKSASPKSINTNPTNSIKLYQNNPNPFGKETEIKFAIPETVKQASIKIYDLSGKQLRSIEINDRNEASVKIFAKEFPAGMYIYSLITDGNEADSKRMILTDN